MITEAVPSALVGQRLDRIVALIGDLSRSEAAATIEAGGVRLTEAPCRQQICRRQGRISRRGETIVCVPNRLVIAITGAAGSRDVDAVVR